MKLHIGDGLLLPLDWMSMATVVYGARGSGKTTLGSVVAEEVHKAGQRFCAIDLKGDWYGLKSSADGKKEGIPVVVFGGDHADLPLEEGAGAFVAETIATLEQPAIIDLENFSKGKQIRFLSTFFATLYDKNREPLLLLLDESQRYAPQKPMSPEGQVCLGAIEDLVKLGRKHGIGVVLFTQRGSGLNKEVSEICDMLVAFRTPGPLDQDRVKDWLDANVTKDERDRVLGFLAGLETGTAVFASGHPDLKLFRVAHVRRRDTFDSSATPKVGRRRVEPKQLAKPDLEALKVKMAATIERAKQDDPRELRRQVETLRRAVNDERNAKDHLKQLYAEALEKKKEQRVEVLKDAQVKRLETALTRMETQAQKFGQAMALLWGHQEEAARALRNALQAAAGMKLNPARVIPLAGAREADVSRAQRGADVGAPMRTRSAGDPASPPPADLPPAKQRILNALAFLEGIGVAQADKTQLALLADARPTSGAYFNNLGALRTASLIIYPTAGRVCLTSSGRAGSNTDGIPATTAELHEAIRRKLPPAKWKIVEELIACYPNAIAKDELAVLSGARATSGAYFNNLGSLRSLGLIAYPTPGQVVAQPVLFLEDR